MILADPDPGATTMANCHEMKQNEIYTCAACGIELKVVKECQDPVAGSGDCGCHPAANPCTFSCCGVELTKKA
jgi:hypothetical protein